MTESSSTAGTLPKRRELSFKDKFLVLFVSIVLFTILRLVHATLRYRRVNEEHLKKVAPTGKEPNALAAWHQNTILSMTGHRKDGYAVMISSSADGQIISNVTEWFGMGTVRGSSSVGGKAALEAMIDRAAEGKKVAFTVDGPKGPAHEVKLGVLKVAESTGIPILPSLSLAERCWSFPKTWDNFRFPKPFSRIHLIYGEPLYVPKGADLSEYQQKLKSILDGLDEEAKSKGLSPIG